MKLPIILLNIKKNEQWNEPFLIQGISSFLWQVQQTVKNFNPKLS